MNLLKVPIVLIAVLQEYQKQDRNELLYQRFKINYTNDIPAIFRQGTCTLHTEVCNSHSHSSSPKAVVEIQKLLLSQNSYELLKFLKYHLKLFDTVQSTVPHTPQQSDFCTLLLPFPFLFLRSDT